MKVWGRSGQTTDCNLSLTKMSASGDQITVVAALKAGTPMHSAPKRPIKTPNGKPTFVHENYARRLYIRRL